MSKQQEKEAFFAQYWGQKVALIPDFDQGETLIKSSVNRMRDVNYLLLTSLSDISDEDLRYIGTLLYGDMYHKDVLINRGRQIFWFHWGSINRPTKEQSLSHFDASECNDLESETLLVLSDYLRSKGYLLPFRNYSVEDIIKLGWAKVK